MWDSSARLPEAGFTLLEILIAITLLAFITLGVVNITENSVLTKERTVELNKNNLQIETALNRFEWDFSQIYSPLYFSTVMNMNANTMTDGSGNPPPNPNPGQPAGDPGMNMALQNYYEQLVQRFQNNENFMAVSKDGMPIPRFHFPDKSTFEFFTSSNRRKLENTKQSHFAWVRYSLADQDDLPAEDAEEAAEIPKNLKSLVRYFTADNPYSDKRMDVESGDIKGAVLLRNVESLEFQFWDYAKRKWQTSLRAIPGGESVIRGVKLMITWYDSRGNKRSTERIFRNMWPMVAPQDPAPTVPTGGAPGGFPGGGINSGVNPGLNFGPGSGVGAGGIEGEGE